MWLTWQHAVWNVRYFTVFELGKAPLAVAQYVRPLKVPCLLSESGFHHSQALQQRLAVIFPTCSKPLTGIALEFPWIFMPLYADAVAVAGCCSTSLGRTVIELWILDP